MTSKSQNDNGSKDNELQGEGNYEAARHYNEKTTAFASDQEKVDEAAEEAKAAIEGEEASELAAAEKKGKAPARD
jgi:hypothetical protein